MEIGNEKDTTLEPIVFGTSHQKTTLLSKYFIYVDLVESCLTASSITLV
jgi:hypothetical protein